MLLYASLPAKNQLQKPLLFEIFLYFSNFLYFFSKCIFLFLNCSLFCSDVIVVGVWLLGAIIFDWLALAG
jgi:hypothetical protein